MIEILCKGETDGDFLLPFCRRDDVDVLQYHYVLDRKRTYLDIRHIVGTACSRGQRLTDTMLVEVPVAEVPLARITGYPHIHVSWYL